MMHWHGWQRDQITVQAETVRIATADRDCKRYGGGIYGCFKSDQMSARDAAIAAARATGSFYNAARDRNGQAPSRRLSRRR